LRMKTLSLPLRISLEMAPRRFCMRRVLFETQRWQTQVSCVARSMKGQLGRAHRTAQALAGMGARRLMLAFSGRRNAGTVGTGPAGHWHCRRWSLRSWWRERPVRSTHSRNSPAQTDRQERVRNLGPEGVSSRNRAG
jgi:hypothetical protein